MSLLDSKSKSTMPSSKERASSKKIVDGKKDDKKPTITLTQKLHMGTKASLENDRGYERFTMPSSGETGEDYYKSKTYNRIGKRPYKDY